MDDDTDGFYNMTVADRGKLDRTQEKCVRHIPLRRGERKEGYEIQVDRVNGATS